jgi:hypothetical protein
MHWCYELNCITTSTSDSLFLPAHTAATHQSNVLVSAYAEFTNSLLHVSRLLVLQTHLKGGIWIWNQLAPPPPTLPPPYPFLPPRLHPTHPSLPPSPLSLPLCLSLRHFFPPPLPPHPLPPLHKSLMLHVSRARHNNWRPQATSWICGH